jgi:hypothetical protein
MTLSALGIFSAAGAGAAVTGSYDLISTTTLGTASSFVTFSNLGDYSSTYKHLQVRLMARDTDSYGGGLVLRGTFNGSSSGYTFHQLNGGGSSVTSGAGTSQSYLRAGIYAGGGLTSGQFAASVIDILDFASSTKNKTIRSLSGSDGVTIYLLSGLWINTAPITSITFTSDTTAFATGSRFSLYGIRG